MIILHCSLSPDSNNNLKENKITRYLASWKIQKRTYFIHQRKKHFKVLRDILLRTFIFETTQHNRQ